MKFNHFSIVNKSLDEKLEDLENLGFHWSVFWSDKKILKDFFITSPIDMTTFQATEKLDLMDFLKSDEPLTWEIFYALALQLLDFQAHFEFQLNQSIEFTQSINLPVCDYNETMNAEHLVEALYLLLCSRRKNGMTLVEQLVSEGLITEDNQHHFFNDKSLATFTTHDLIREEIYVESAVDSLQRGENDLIKVQIIRPKFAGKLPSVMTASPYHLGINIVANDKKLHKMENELIEKEASKISVHNQLPSATDYKSVVAPEAQTADYSFTHGWTYSLNNYFLSRGFASIYVAGIGTRSSDGFQSSGDYKQVYSMTAVIDWLNGRAKAYTSKKKLREIKASWSNGKVAMTGKSYLGTMAYGAATTGVKGLEVILAEAGISSWYSYYREGGLVRSPGGYPGEDLDVLAELTYSKNLDASDYLKNNSHYQLLLRGMTKAIDRESGDYNQYWHDRNYLPHADKVTADVLIVHGLQDWNVTPDQAYHFWKALPKNAVKHAFLHRGSHIYMNSWQSIDFSETINAYFTSKLLDRPMNLALPPVILQENGKAQSFISVDEFGQDKRLALSLGYSEVSFDNHYEEASFQKYSADFNLFKKDLFENQANAACLDIEIPEDVMVNGQLELDLKIKVSDSKAILSAQVLDFGEEKRLSDRASLLDIKSIDLGRNFALEDLLELPLQTSPYQLLSKGFLNLQNRENWLKISPITENQWMNVKLVLQPTIYQLKKGNQLRVLLYSTDFEHTVRDNRQATYTVDLAASQLILPY